MQLRFRLLGTTQSPLIGARAGRVGTRRRTSNFIIVYKLLGLGGFGKPANALDKMAKFSILLRLAGYLPDGISAAPPGSNELPCQGLRHQKMLLGLVFLGVINTMEFSGRARVRTRGLFNSVVEGSDLVLIGCVGKHRRNGCRRSAGLDWECESEREPIPTFNTLNLPVFDLLVITSAPPANRCSGRMELFREGVTRCHM